MAQRSRSPAANGARPDISADLKAEISTGTPASAQPQTAAASGAALEREPARSPTRLRKTVEALAKVLRRRVVAALATPSLQDFARDGDVGGGP